MDASALYDSTGREHLRCECRQRLSAPTRARGVCGRRFQSGSRFFAGFNANEGVLFTFDMGIETNDDLQEALVEWGEYYGLSDPTALETTYA